jgi:hypothetical protein
MSLGKEPIKLTTPLDLTRPELRRIARNELHDLGRQIREMADILAGIYHRNGGNYVDSSIVAKELLREYPVRSVEKFIEMLKNAEEETRRNNEEKEDGGVAEKTGELVNA